MAMTFLQAIGLTDWSSFAWGFAWGFGAMLLLVALFCGFILPAIIDAPILGEASDDTQ